MENVDLVLDFIAKNEKITQRKISRNTNLALGNINAILKMCIKKGLIKVEAVNRNSIRYILTPEGVIEKTRITYNYLQSAVKRVMTLKSNLDLIFSNEEAKNKQVVLLGKNDDTQTVLRQLISEQNLSNVLWIDDFQKVLEMDDAFILLWQPEALQKCWHHGVKYINLLSTAQVENCYE